ncbi:T6SS effector BTH_I2691 family protein [Pseudacidovorax intermedius]|nr:T6SS effector BTH_I2691 family protein [Pseudacidovorax intermedius]
MSDPDKCKRCGNKAGLPILLVRPSAIASDPDFAPAEAARLKTHEPSVEALGLPALDASRYVLRMLRQGGFVYAYYTKRPPHLINPWQAFRVQGSGVLIPESQIVWMNQKAEFACNMRESHPNDLRTLCIQLPRKDPGTSGKVWIGFSMNWWDDAMRARVQKDPAAAGMVCIDPLQDLGGVQQAFKADVHAMEDHIADFALRSMNHGGTKSGYNVTNGGTQPATPFYNTPDDKTYGQARGLQTVMQQQAEGHPITRGKAFVLVLPDPVGLGADLNGIRMAKDRANKNAWLANQDWVRSEACYTTLEGLRKSIVAAAALQSFEGATVASEKQWQSIRHRVQGVTYEWSPDPSGAYAEDGSRAGRMRPTDRHAKDFAGRVERDSRILAQRNWARITDQLDTARFRAWPAKREQIEKQMDNALAAYEADWLKVVGRPATRNYFKTHFDENDAGKITAVVSSGQIYAAESDLIHYPQPLTARHIERWVGLILDAEITSPDAVALRAFFGNQKSVLEKAKAVLVGKADRSEGDSRDKTYELAKGVLTHDLFRRFNWLHPRLMAFSAGGLAATAAGVFQLMAMMSDRSPAPQSGKLAKYRAMLGGLTLAQRQLELAVESALPTGNKAILSTAILLEVQVDADTALRVLNGYLPKGQKAVVVARGKTVSLQVLTDVKTALAVREGHVRAESIPGARVEVARAVGGHAVRSLEDVQLQAARLPVSEPLTPAQVAEVMVRQTTIKELNLNSVEGRLALGAMVVQGLGLYQGIPQLLAELNKSQRDQDKINEAAIGVLDSLGGFVGASAELWASAHKANLLLKPGGEHLVEASGRLAVLRTTAAVTGMLGAVITFYLMGKKADGAKAEGDEQSFKGYKTSSVAGLLLIATGGVSVADAAAKQIASRAIARHVVLRMAGAVATEAAIAGAAGTVAAVVSGVGLVLMLVAIGGYVYATVNERDSYQRWAGRCYFGNDGVKRFATAADEQHWLMAIEYEADAQNELMRKAQKYPDPGRDVPAPLGNPMGDGWGGGAIP